MMRRTISPCAVSAGTTCSIPPGSKWSSRYQPLISAVPYFLRIVIGAEDALDDDVEAVTERVPRYEVDQPDVRSVGDVTLTQHVAAQVVLPDLSDQRVVLREHDRPGAANIGLIDLTCRYAMGAGFCTVLEGIFYSEHCGDMLAELRAEYGDRSSWWYLDVPFEQTVERHATKPQAAD
jgi:hypothetical protein